MTRETLVAAVRALRTEGVASVVDRTVDRWREHRAVRLVSFDEEQWPRAAVINVLGSPAAVRGGGVPLQLLARLSHESVVRPVVLLARHDDRFRVTCWHHGKRSDAVLPGGPWDGDPLAGDEAWLSAVRAVVSRVGTAAVHVENLAGLSFASLSQLASSGVRLVLSLHDFGAFCRRPHLLDSTGHFCRYSTSDTVCRQCLNASGVTRVEQLRHRATASELLAGADAVVFPSSFLRDEVARLLAWPGGHSAHIIEPGVDTASPAASIRDPQEVAFLGGGDVHKGGRRWPTLARALTARGMRVTAYGGNGFDALHRLRELPGVRVRGYYRAGTLPTLLARQRAAVAVLLPGVPESFSLALSEAWVAGVPVVASAQGALAHRLEAGGGRVLSAEPSDEEVVEAVDALRRSPVPSMPAVPTAADAAAQYAALYRRLGFSTVR